MNELKLLIFLVGFMFLLAGVVGLIGLDRQMGTVYTIVGLAGKLTGFKVPTSFNTYDSILIVDDICDAGGTFIGIADALRKEGVKQDLYLYVTHGIFSKGLDELGKRYKKIFTSSSLPNKPDDRLVVLESEGLILDSLQSREQLWETAAKGRK